MCCSVSEGAHLTLIRYWTYLNYLLALQAELEMFGSRVKIILTEKSSKSVIWKAILQTL
jgi:hypothetical protein